MAHKKGVGSTDNGRDSKSKRLGVKLFGGQRAQAGNILVRQRGTRYHAGQNVYMGRDHTLHAAIDGTVVFRRSKNDRSYVSVMPFDVVDETPDVVPPKQIDKPVQAPTPVTEPHPVADVPEDTAPPVTDVATPADDIATPAEENTATPVVADDKAADEEPVKPAKPAKTPALNDLKIVEGIGPKIEQLLKEGGIDTWEALASAEVSRLREILEAAGSRYQMHDPSTWPAQSRFAAEGKWEELKEYQDMLIGGRNAD